MRTPTPWETIQGSRVLAIGRCLKVLVLGGVLVLAPSTLDTMREPSHFLLNRCSINMFHNGIDLNNNSRAQQFFSP